MDSLIQLNKDILACQHCPLRIGATAPVCGTGVIRAKYMLVGESPGREEDENGIPFIGASGKKLDKLLKVGNIDPNVCYFSNTVRCRPPGNRTPKKKEIRSCLPWLLREITLVQPEYVVTLGSVPLSLFSDYGLKTMHGTLFSAEIEGNQIKVIASYHPAAALHQPRLWAVLLDDWANPPGDVPHDFIVTDKPPTHASLVAMDTENDPSGKIGTWSLAYRGVDGQLYVKSDFGPRPEFTIRGDCPVVFHNYKWDARVLKRNGMKPPTNIHDTMIMAYTLGFGRQDVHDSDSENADNMVGGLGLKYLARRHLGMRMRTWREVMDSPESDIMEYNANDSVATFLLAEKWLPILPEHYHTIDMPLLQTIMAIEDRGIMVDPAFLKKYADSLDARLKSMVLPLNPFSPDQIGAYIYGQLGIEPWKFTDSGAPSTDASVLETIDDPVVAQILEYKALYKERGTYVGKYVNQVGPDGRIHCELKQTRTATGRLSSANPNLQNVVKEGDMRALFVAPAGKKLVRLDFDQLELRVFAVLTGDEVMLKIYRDGGDIHAETMTALGLDDRRAAKVFNFQMIYGGEAWKFSQQYHIPIDEAKRLMKRYFERFPGVKRYAEQQKELASTVKEVINYFGRKRRLDSMYAEDWRVRQEGEREAINTPIQGTAADIVKLVMNDLHYVHSAPMLLQVHDELLFEVDDRDAEEYASWLRSYVPTIITIRGMTFPVKVGIGQNWKEATHNEK